eukprot:6467113-Amphidinium_carterae.1
MLNGCIARDQVDTINAFQKLVPGCLGRNEEHYRMCYAVLTLRFTTCPTQRSVAPHLPLASWVCGICTCSEAAHQRKHYLAKFDDQKTLLIMVAKG